MADPKTLFQLSQDVEKLEKRQDLLPHELVSMRRKILQQDLRMREQIYKQSKHEKVYDGDRLRHRNLND